MKKAIKYMPSWQQILLLGLLLGNALNGYAQFQTTIGFPNPSSEFSPGGIITPAGDFLILGGNQDHPNGIPNALYDMQLDWLDAAGNLVQPSEYLFGPNTTASWIEKNVFCGGNSFVIAGGIDSDMLLTRTNLSGAPIWSRRLGSPTDVEESVWAEMDANGLIHVVGNHYDANTAMASVVVAQVDCNGNNNWRRTYFWGGHSLRAQSATTFTTIPGGANGEMYITGKAYIPGVGTEEVFILKINTTTGGLIFLRTYDVTPNAHDAGTCIQGSAASGPQGGEIWVSGYSSTVNGPEQIMLMKTDLNGIPVWANNYDIPGGDESATHLEFAANGKLVVTGKAEVLNGSGGDCMLMRVDMSSGNTIDWTRVFTNQDAGSIATRVEVTTNDEYFVTGYSFESSAPRPSINIVAFKTDAQGLTGDASCYHDVMPSIIPRTAVITGVPLAQFGFGTVPDFLPFTLNEFKFTDQQISCASPPPCDCDFTWNNGNCFDVTFNANCNNAQAGNYTYIWDINCDNNPELNVVIPSSNQAFTYTFPCGGGTYQVCLKVIDPAGTICNITHTVVVPNTCCGTVSGNLSCHPTDPYKYNFTVNVTNPLGLTNCSYLLTSPNPLSNVVYSGNTITGCVSVTDPVPLGLGFSLQSNCICATTGLPTTCTQAFTLATVCCKEIHVDDQVVCATADDFDVPVYASNWPPLNNVYQVTWYVMPKPASGICPPPLWGIQPYQSTVVSNVLEPLHLFPNALPSDLCVYAVVDLNDGPCTQLVSDVAMVQLCNPNSCTLNSQSICYTGACVIPNPITITSTAVQPTCLGLVEWFDPAGNSVQIGGSSYQPPCLSMVDDQHCYEDFVYTVVITDDCGQHSCTASVRLYSANAPVGSLTVNPSEPLPVCWAEDLTLNFIPGCVGEPPMWHWYERDCLGNVQLVPGAGTNNAFLNLNELHNSAWYGVSASNGVCPPTGVEKFIEVIEPAVLFNFDAVPDPCAEIQVTLSASVVPGVVNCTNTPFPCTYTYEWYKDGFLIGTTNGSASASFVYLNPNPPNTMAGNYYAIIKEDCCPRNALATWVVPVGMACEPTVMGPCFICDFQPEVYMVQMVLPPNKPCPDVCTYEWFTAVLNSNGDCVPGVSLGTNATVIISTPGQYFVQSDCNGCIKLLKFDVLGCTSAQNFGADGECGVIIAVKDLMPEHESPLRVFPNPTTGEITVEWTGNAPKNARIFITDPMGRRLRMLTVPDAANSLTTNLEDLPSGLYFVKVQSADRLFTVAKLVKE